MTVFYLALSSVAMLLLVAMVGFIFIKRDMMKPDVIPALSKILMYVCQPCLAVYSFSILEFSTETLARLGLFALMVTVLHAVMIGGAYLVLRHKAKEAIYRILILATTFSNCGFFGIPIIEALLPEAASGLIVYTTVYSMVMNLFAWTVGSAIITGDVKYISLKSTFLNPAVLGLAAALALYLLRVDMPAPALSMITMAGRMATPLSMLIIGMRLALIDLKRLFTDYRIYLTSAVNQILMPLAVFAVMMLLPMVDPYLRKTLFILTACPVASIVLNFAEILGKGQGEAANTVLLSTVLSIVTLPFTMLLLPLIG